jgi:AcrR family transcriptional regulator
LSTRQRVRREDLLEAGIALLGDEERPGVTVRGVCRRAGLTERYFYESFTDRGEFVRAVYRDVGARAHEAVAAAVQAHPRELARAAVEAFVQLLVDKPSMGRVLLIAPLSDPALSEQGQALVPGFVTLVHDQLSEVVDPQRKEMIALGVVGALTTLFVAYLGGTLTVPRQRLVDHCVALVLDSNRRC